MKTYIVSIYRQDKENDVLAGTVEEAGGTEKKVFHSFEDLRQIMRSAGEGSNRGKVPVLPENNLNNHPE